MPNSRSSWIRVLKMIPQGLLYLGGYATIRHSMRWLLGRSAGIPAPDNTITIVMVVLVASMAVMLWAALAVRLSARSSAQPDPVRTVLVRTVPVHSGSAA